MRKLIEEKYPRVPPIVPSGLVEYLENELGLNMENLIDMLNENDVSCDYKFGYLTGVRNVMFHIKKLADEKEGDE